MVVQDKMRKGRKKKMNQILKKSMAYILILALFLTLFAAFAPTEVQAKTYSKTTAAKIAKTVPKITSIKSTSSGMKISFKKVAKAEGYTVYRVTKVNGKTKYSKLGTTKKLYYYHKSGSYGTTYKYAVEAYYGKTKSKKSKVVSKKYDVLAAPELIAKTDDKKGVILLEWQPVKGAAEYEIYAANRQRGDTGYSLIASVKNTQYEARIENLNERYRYKIRAVSSGKSSKYSNEVSSGIFVNAPHITSSLETVDGKVYINIEPNTAIDDYKVEYNAGYGNWTEIKSFISKKEDELVFNAPYFNVNQYRLIPIKHFTGGKEAAAASSYAQVHVNPGIKLTIEKINVDEKTRTVSVQWKGLTQAVKYDIGLSNEQNLAIKSTTTTSCTFSLTKSGTHQVSLEAIDSKGNKVKTSTTFTCWLDNNNDDITPSNPSTGNTEKTYYENGITCKVNGATATTSFSSVTGATRYEIQYIGIGSLPIVRIDVNSNSTMIEKSTVLQYNGSYYVTVVAYNGSSELARIDGPKITLSEASGGEYEPIIKKCTISDCNGLRSGMSQYCFNHTCITEGCNHYKDAWQFYCTTHRCNFSGCTYGKDEGSNFCKAHHCMEPNCGREKENSYFCSMHTRCAISSCNNVRDGATRYCRQHAAMNFK